MGRETLEAGAVEVRPQRVQAGDPAGRPGSALLRRARGGGLLLRGPTAGQSRAPIREIFFFPAAPHRQSTLPREAGTFVVFPVPLADNTRPLADGRASQESQGSKGSSAAVGGAGNCSVAQTTLGLSTPD